MQNAAATKRCAIKGKETRMIKASAFLSLKEIEGSTKASFHNHFYPTFTRKRTKGASVGVSGIVKNCILIKKSHRNSKATSIDVKKSLLPSLSSSSS
jgi:hypothetical protein